LLVDCTTKEAQPPDVTWGDEVCSVVACAAPPVLEVKARSIESITVVTVLLLASFTQTVIVEVETPLAGIGLGDAVALRCVGAPEPVNEIVVEAGVSEPDVAVAVHDSATLSAMWNVTVVPVDGVVAVAGLPLPPTGVVLTTVAPQCVTVPGLNISSVTGVGPKTLLPAASCTCTVTSHVEPGVLDAVGVFTQLLPVIASFAAGPAASTLAAADPDARPGTDAVTVQLPGAPVVVSVVVVLLDPCGIVA